MVLTIVTNVLSEFGAVLGFGLFNWATMRPLEWWLFTRCP